MSDADKKDDAPKKKGGMMKMVILGVGGIVLIGGGVGAGVFVATSGMVGHGKAAAAVPEGPALVPKSQEKRVAAGDGGEGGKKSDLGKPGEGGDKYASNYYVMDKEFTSNLQNSVHFVQLGVAISTPYDDTVLTNLKTHEIAVRSAILMALGNATEDQVFTSQGKQLLQRQIAKAINDVLIQKEGFGGVGNVYFTTFVVQ